MYGLPILVTTVLTLVGSATAGKSKGCGNTSPTIKDASARTMTVNGKSRQYYVNVPANYDPNHAYRLVFTLHALGGNAGQVTNGTGGYLPWYGLPDLIKDEIGAIYISPNGISNGWGNAGGEDISFIKQLVETVEADLCVEQSLRFSTGFSYGAAMSYSIACSLGKQIRAVAVLSGGLLSGCAGGTEPVAYYGQHGIGDTTLTITMGRQMRDRFVKNNGCTAMTPQEPTRGSSTRIKTKYEGCGEYPVVWVAFDGPHTPQPTVQGSTKTFSADETWEFFKQFQPKS